MARYSIDGQILTDIADGIREKVGKSEGVPGLVEAIYQAEGEGRSTDFTTDMNVFVLTVQTPLETKKVLVKDIVITSEENTELFFKVGYCQDATYYRISPATEYRVGGEDTPTEILIDATDMYLRIGASSKYVRTKIKITATVIALDENGEVLFQEGLVPYFITPEQMADEISDMAIVPSEAFNLTGNCNSRFANGTLDWLINSYGDRITTEDITAAQQMFYYSGVKHIPFEINMSSNSPTTINGMFNYAAYLEEIPKINGKPKPNDTTNMFSSCSRLRYLPEDIESWFDWSYVDTATGAYNGGKRGGGIFSYCHSLRSIPMSFLNHNNPYATSTSNLFYYLFQNCYALDELVDIPIFGAEKMKWKSNCFSSTFSGCSRLKNLTFATNEDGSPIQVNWKSQTIDLSSNVGYVVAYYYITDDYNSGITRSKWVFDNATYQALKNDPDWFSNQVEYSRYNHDSAVATINSLPDTTSSDGTNTIKFKGASGSATDGGAINTLTEEEIAVATAKGWTVSLV